MGMYKDGVAGAQRRDIISVEGMEGQCERR